MSTYGGVEQRWVLIYSEARQPQAQRAVDKQLRQLTDKEVKAFKTCCRTTFACEADARRTLAAFEQGLQVTFLATNELDATQLTPQELLEGYKGQVQAERGFRLMKDPSFLASSLYLKKPERIMALFMVITVCLLVYAALEYRIPQALKAHEATFPDQKGKQIRNPTARWVLHYFVGIHLLCQAGQWPIVLNLTEDHQHLLRLLGRPYMRFYDVRYS
jgi:transposase